MSASWVDSRPLVSSLRSESHSASLAWRGRQMDQPSECWAAQVWVGSTEGHRDQFEVSGVPLGTECHQSLFEMTCAQGQSFLEIELTEGCPLSRCWTCRVTKIRKSRDRDSVWGVPSQLLDLISKFY